MGTNNIMGILGIGGGNTTAQSIHESMVEGTSAIISENEMNFATLMKTVGVNELAYFSENGTQIVYEAGTLSDFFANVRKFFEAMKKKVIELFNKFLAQIDAWVRSDEVFVKKNRTKILARETSGMKYKGYKFTTSAASSVTANNKLDMFLASKNMTQANATVKTGAAIETQRGYAKAYRDNKSDIMDEMRGSAVGKGKLTNSEFQTELTKVFRNGKEEKEEFTPNMNDQLLIITGAKKQKEEAKKSMEDIKKSIDKVVSDLKKVETDLGKYDKDSTEDVIKGKSAASYYVSTLVEAQKDKLNTVQRVHGALMSAIKAENRQAKSICVRALGYNAKKESANLGGSNPSAGLKFI